MRIGGYHVYNFMYEEDKLNLKGAELPIYAIIYQSTQDFLSVFCGSLNDVAQMAGVDKRTAKRVIQQLLDKKLILVSNIVKNNIIGYQVNAESLGEKPRNDYDTKEDYENNEIEKSVVSFENNVPKSKPQEQKPKQNGAFEQFAKGNQKLLQALYDFKQMRTRIRKPLTDRAIQLLLNKLSEYKTDEQIAMLEQSIFNSWQGIFPIKEEEKKKKGGYYDSKGKYHPIHGCYTREQALKDLANSEDGEIKIPWGV